VTEKFSAGIFVADDSIIVAHTLSTGKAPSLIGLDDVWIDRFPASSQLESDLRSALSRIAVHCVASGIQNVSDIAVAVPGPVKVSGMRIESLERDSLRSDYGSFRQVLRRSEFAGMNVRSIVASILSEDAMQPFREPKIFVYHDAAAYAYGDFRLRRIEFIRKSIAEDIVLQGDANTIGKREQLFNRSEIHALILADEGVGGAIIAEGIVAQGPTHSEMGHVPIQRHHLDRSFRATCAVHEREGCLESLVALRALRARWGSNKHALPGGYSDWHEDDERLWTIAYYVSQLVVMLTLILAPTHVALAGRVLTSNPNLIRMIRGLVVSLCRTSPSSPPLYPGYEQQTSRHFIELVVDRDAGVYGATMLAYDADRTARIIGYQSVRREPN
jgi:hypothetical protein